MSLINTALFLFLISIYTNRIAEFKIKEILRDYSYIYLVIVFLITSDCLYLFNSEPLVVDDYNTLTLMGGLISGIVFILFFNKLDSLFIDIPKGYIIFLIVYGIIQCVFPILLNHKELVFENQLVTILFIAIIFVMMLSKIILTRVIMSQKYVHKMIPYFDHLLSPKN